MAACLRIFAIVLLITIAGAGCRSTFDPCCDRSPSLADWLDCHGCTGCDHNSNCSRCSHCSGAGSCDECDATFN